VLTSESMSRKNVAILKQYGEKLKLTLCNNSGNYKYDFQLKGKRGEVNKEKLDCNLSRAKGIVYEYAACNPWELFGTFTIDGKKYPRNDLKGFYSKYGDWLKYYNKKNNLSIKYVNIPELHDDEENWHMHGILQGLPISHLRKFKKGDLSEKGKPIKKYLWEKGYYYWPGYQKKFGFCSFGTIKNKDAAAKYLTKYITKDMTKSVNELNAKSYYCSRGLKKAEELKRGYLGRSPLDSEFDYVGDYTKVKWFNLEDLYFVNEIIIPFENI
jgi:hypothetical protein